MVFVSQKDKKTFRDIVLTHLGKILEISLDEFRGGYTKKEIKGNYAEEIYIPDSRKRMCQAIEFFSFLLQPHYDKNMKEKSEEIKEKIQENLDAFNGKENKSDKKNKKDNSSEENKMTKEDFMINKLRLMKELFEEMNYLLQRLKYLKEETYQESVDELDDEDDEE